MRTKLFIISLILTLWSTATAQIVTTSPAILQLQSRDIVITFHADQGNKGLANLPDGQEVYAHTGVILNGSDQWSHAPNWLDNSAKYKLTRTGENTYTLSMTSIAQYYGLTTGEDPVKLAFVFRNADGSREGKADGNADIFVDVLPDGLQMTLTDNVGGSINTGSSATFTVATSETADITLSIEGESAPLATASNATTLTHTATFTTAAQVTLVASAKTATDMIEKKITLAVLDNATQADYPGGIPVMGTVEQSDGSVIFCIAAPGKSNVTIVGSWNDYKVTQESNMNYQDYQGNRYFWVRVPALTNNTDHLYYFLVDNSRKVGDPYARLVLDPYNDRYIPSSVFPDMPAYPTDKVSDVYLAVYNPSRDKYNWAVTDFKGVDQSQLVIYEVLIRDFTGTEGQANAEGNIQGLIDKLDYIRSLGVNAVELMPIMEFAGNNSWGYNPNFYFAPDKAYGTPNDYRRLIDECHSRGLAVILDIVFNQSDGGHPWYQMYDIAKNPFYNGSAPHAYSVLNDWNQDNSIVMQQWRDALAYWMTQYKADGFRFDLVKGLGDNDSYGNTYNPSTNTFGTPSDDNTNRYNQSRIDRMKELHAAMRLINPDAYFINEDLAGADEENELATDGDTNWANINYAAREYACYDIPSSTSHTANLNRFYAPLDDNRTWGSTVSYAESHDEERMAYAQQQSGVSQLKNTATAMRRLGSVAAQMLMAPGAHMIWQFQEFGADESTKNGDGGNNTDPKKVVWSYLDDPDRNGLKDCYAELCAIRHNNPEMFTQSAGTTMACGSDNWSNGRYIKLTNGTSEIICVVNPVIAGNKTITVPMDGSASEYEILSKSYNTTPTVADGKVTVTGSGYAVIGRNVKSSVDDVQADAALPYTISVEGRRITVTGDFTTAVAYSISGMHVALGATVAPGIYIVNVDGHSTKVAVR